MTTTQIRIDTAVLQRLEAQKPRYLTTTGFISQIVEQALDGVLTLTEPKATPQAGPQREAKSLCSSVLNKRDIDVSLQAEEAHIEPAALEAVKRKPTFVKSIPPNLTCHDDLIEAYWKAKPKTKTQAAWNLLIGELTRMQERYGDSVLRDQLKLAEANRWQGVTVRNYEQFGMDKPKTSARGHVMDFDWESINGMSI